MLARLLGLRVRFTVDGVRYREVRRKTRGRSRDLQRTFDVQFPDGAAMRIVATADRVFADIAGESVLEPYQPAQHLLHPGMRVLVLESGTGAAANMTAHLVASAGAVVALERDQQSIEYATHRYRLPNVSFEAVGIEGLAGETDGAFDAVLAVGALRRDDDARAVLTELWRVVGSGGVLLLGVPRPVKHAGGTLREAMTPGSLSSFLPEQLTAIVESALVAGGQPEQVSIYSRGNWIYAVLRRPPAE